VRWCCGITAASTWWAGRQEAQIGKQLAGARLPGDIRMLSSDTCGICANITPASKHAFW
jgi:hypothetical protein